MSDFLRAHDPDKIELVDRCCPGLIGRIEAASGREVIAVVYECWEDRGLFPPSGVIFRDYSHAAKELVERCIAEAPVADIVPLHSAS